MKISGLGSTLESMIDLLIQALRRLGSDSLVVTQICWITEEGLSADCTWPASSLHICFTNAHLTDPTYAELIDAFKTFVVGNTYNGLGSLNFLFDHCDLKILSTAVGTLSSLCDGEICGMLLM